MRGILIAGKMLSGKDHVANYIVSSLMQNGIEARRFGWADALKEEAARALSFLLGREITVQEIERDKPIYRPFLQGLGQTMRRIDPDYWVRAAMETLDHQDDLNRLAGRAPFFWVNSDTRMPNEVAMKRHGFLVVRLAVSRENQLKRMLRRDGVIDESGLYHETEVALDEMEKAGPGEGPDRFDVILEDMPLEQLYTEIDRVLADGGVLPQVRAGAGA